MGFMKAWENWSRKQYDVWGSKLQDKYNFWKEYDDPELRAKCQAIWVLLPSDLQKKIYKMLMAVLKKYGPEMAKKIIKGLTEAFI